MDVLITIVIFFISAIINLSNENEIVKKYHLAQCVHKGKMFILLRINVISVK